MVRSGPDESGAGGSYASRWAFSSGATSNFCIVTIGSVTAFTFFGSPSPISSTNRLLAAWCNDERRGKDALTGLSLKSILRPDEPLARG